MGEEADDEEAQCLTRGKGEGDVSLVKQEKKVGSNVNFEKEEDMEEDKRE